MLLKIRHGIIEITNYPATRKSAIIINNEIIFTAGSILEPYVRPMTAHGLRNETNENICISTKIIKQLQENHLIKVHDESTDEARFLDLLNCQIMFDNRYENIPLRDGNQPRILSRTSIKILYVFNSTEVSRPLQSLIEAGYGNGDILLSSFLVFSKRPFNDQASLKRSLLYIARYLQFLQPLQILDDVVTICTPFGLQPFYKSVSIGKVANVIGTKGSVFMLSNSLPLGCEGSAVFNSRLRFVGIIICTLLTSQSENVNLTLVANFAHLLKGFMQQLGIQISLLTLPKEPPNFVWETSVVIVEGAGCQGTGTLIKVHQKKFLLTCSHVVFKVAASKDISRPKYVHSFFSFNHAKLNTAASCRGICGVFESEVIWHNPEYNKAYDVALLTVPDSIPERYCVRLSTAKPTLGQIVYNAGFPNIAHFNFKYNLNPSIFQGRIIRCLPGAIMSDGSVQSGQSGGPMFDQNNSILGICVSNIKMGEVVYPNINTAVPIYEIQKHLEQFAKTNDKTVLNNLVANEEIQNFWSLGGTQAYSKL